MGIETGGSGGNTVRPRTPVVLVHGSGDSARCWGGVVERLGWGPDRLVALDLPGHGARANEAPPAPEIAAYAAAVRQEIVRLGLPRVALVGHSLGSIITLTLALDTPDLVERIALLGTGARLRVLPALLEGAHADPQATQLRLSELGHAPGHEAMAAAYTATLAPTARDAFYHDLAACNSFDLMGDVQRVTQPALVMAGAEDRLTPPKYAEYLAQHLPHATLIVVPDAGHYLMDEAPDAVAQALRRWAEEGE
jgi:pimeloyl-ACP methyl ester carboxylesterase